MILRLGKKPGTIVTDYEPGQERAYMIEVYGGRLVAEGLTKEDAEQIVRAVNNQEREKQ